MGLKVTLRKDQMYFFLDRLVNIALPRIKDFRGLNPNSFDSEANYSFGVKEHIIFPEVNFDKVDKIRGLDITVVTTAKTKEQARMLLDSFNFPFAKVGIFSADKKKVKKVEDNEKGSEIIILPKSPSTKWGGKGNNSTIQLGIKYKYSYLSILLYSLKVPKSISKLEPA